MSIDTIYRSIQEDLAKVEERLNSVSKVGSAFQAELLDYSVKGGGKRIRPVLTLLAGKFYDYDPSSILPMAAAVELMHTATLVHDDAIDKSMVRRGRPTINKLWGEETAVLLGDYLFAKAGESATDTGNLHVVRLFTQTLQIISSGELDQSYNAFNLGQTRQQYLERVAQKTASLFSLATESGAILSWAPERSVEVLKEYGYNLGIAFQIVDDILDFTSTEEEIGKPIGSDLAQGTLTLLAMLILEHYPEDNPVKRFFKNRNERDNIKRAVELVRNSPVVQEGYQVALEYSSKACHNLNLLPDNASRQSLIELADYVIKRKR
ncbi:polyprenyl synthetase family protein [Chloroflexota bacterium]